MLYLSYEISFSSIVKSFIYEDLTSNFLSYSTKAAKMLLAAFVFYYIE